PREALRLQVVDPRLEGGRVLGVFLSERRADLGGRVVLDGLLAHLEGVEVHVGAREPAADAVEVALAFALTEMSHDLGEAVRLEVVRDRGHDPPKDVGPRGPTVAPAELVDGR